MQHDLFPPDPVVVKAGLFAEVVFDRPLDHAYTYAVGSELVSQVAVGKRVRVPFGRGDRSTVGYCVGLTDVPPGRSVKEIVAVLDEESLLTDAVLRLTRWMADYYLCGWGQVLKAVVPAGARDRAGTAKRVFVEATPEAELPRKVVSLPSKQTAVLKHLREAGRAVEMRQLQRLLKVGSAPVKALLDRGLIRQVVRRVEMLPTTGEERDPGTSVTLNPDQLRAWTAI